MDATARKQRALTSDRVDHSKPAPIIINQRFNGLTHFCELTGYPTSTAWGWVERGFIPPRWRGKSTQPHILAIAAKHKISMEAADFVEQLPQRKVRRPTSPPPVGGDSAAAPPGAAAQHVSALAGNA